MGNCFSIDHIAEDHVHTDITSTTTYTFIFNPLYTGGLYHCYILDKSICHFRGVRSVLSFSFYFLLKILLANNVDPDWTPQYVASGMVLHCLPMALLWISREGLF